MAHNGTISHLPTDKGGRSDSSLFAELLSYMKDNFYRNAASMELISGYIGTDKIVFLNNKGEVYIVNAEYGEEEFGCWFSNDSYEDMPRYCGRYGNTSSSGFSYYNHTPAQSTGKNAGLLPMGNSVQNDIWDQDELEITDDDLPAGPDDDETAEFEAVSTSSGWASVPESSTQRVYCDLCGIDLDDGYEKETGMCLSCITDTMEALEKSRETYERADD